MAIIIPKDDDNWDDITNTLKELNIESNVVTDDEKGIVFEALLQPGQMCVMAVALALDAEYRPRPTRYSLPGTSVPTCPSRSNNLMQDEHLLEISDLDFQINRLEKMLKHIKSERDIAIFEMQEHKASVVNKGKG